MERGRVGSTTARSAGRLLAIPHSTNVERITLALGYKGLDAEIEMVDPMDRTRVREASGQDLVPVLLDGEIVVADSPSILAYLDEVHPEPALSPRDPRVRAEAKVFVQWFNLVWKGPPNEIDARSRAGSLDDARRHELASWLATSLDLMEALLTGRRWLQGGAFGIADCVAFPFIKYALLPPAEHDPDTFHEVLSRYLVLLPRHSGLREWIERINAMPRGGHAPTD